MVTLAGSLASRFPFSRGATSCVYFISRALGILDQTKRWWPSSRRKSLDPKETARASGWLPSLAPTARARLRTAALRLAADAAQLVSQDVLETSLRRPCLASTSPCRGAVLQFSLSIETLLGSMSWSGARGAQGPAKPPEETVGARFRRQLAGMANSLQRPGVRSRAGEDGEGSTELRALLILMVRTCCEHLLTQLLPEKNLEA